MRAELKDVLEKYLDKYPHTAQHWQVRLVREPLPEEQLPQSDRIEQLPAGSAEWQEVNAFFRATAPDAATVLAIQRVENPLLRAKYEARRAAMDARAAAGYGLRGAN